MGKSVFCSFAVVGLVAAMAASGSVHAGECVFVDGASAPDDMPWWADLGDFPQEGGYEGMCWFGNALFDFEMCGEFYRDSDTGEVCNPMEDDGEDDGGDSATSGGGGSGPPPGGGGFPDLGTDGCAGSCDEPEEENSGTVTVQPLETVR